jgi:hypothetical protein
MPGRIKRWFGDGYEAYLAAALVLAWAAGLAAILSHPLFVTNDSLSNYSHVWYVSREFWGGNGVPYHFPEIGHGQALAFPYAFIPWFSAALFRPLLGDWVVTLWLVGGFVGLVAAAWYAFPELRRPALAALFLANPFLVESVILSQLPFLWATAMLFAGIGCWRRGRISLAIVLVGLAQGSHAAVVLPLAGSIAAVAFVFGSDRKRLAVAYALSLVIALPGVLLVFLSPVVEDSSTVSLLKNFLGTVLLRATVVGWPFLLIWARGWLSDRRLALGVLAMTLALNVGLVPIRDSGYAWHAFGRTPDTSLVPFLESSAFAKGATYRILRVADGKVGMYQVIQHGGRLDSEFFPESFHRTSWPDSSAYRAFLSGRRVDFVLIYRAYDERYETNEHALLETLTRGACAVLVEHNRDFDVYRVKPGNDPCDAAIYHELQTADDDSA